MKTKNKLFENQNRKTTLSWLWVFAMFNYIYADIMTLMDSSVLKELVAGGVDGMQMTPGLFLAGAILMEIPIVMVVASRVLKYRVNRWANIVAGLIKTLAVAGSTFVGTPALYYLFFSIIEMATTLFIVWYAWSWKQNE